MTATTETKSQASNGAGAAASGQVQPGEQAASAEVEALTLRAPFPLSMVGLLPKPTRKDAEKGTCDVCHGWHGLPAVHLDYVGHAAVTDRLLSVDPEWNWAPMEREVDTILLAALLQLNDPQTVRDYLESCPPKFVHNEGGRLVGLWIRLTVNGVTRLGYGSVEGAVFDPEKQLIGDSIRNAAMRFGVALDLWIKGQEDEKTGEVGEVTKAKDFGECPSEHCSGRLLQRSKKDGEPFLACSEGRRDDPASCQIKIWPNQGASAIIEAGSIEAYKQQLDESPPPDSPTAAGVMSVYTSVVDTTARRAVFKAHGYDETSTETPNQWLTRLSSNDRAEIAEALRARVDEIPS